MLVVLKLLSYFTWIIAILSAIFSIMSFFSFNLSVQFSAWSTRILRALSVFCQQEKSKFKKKIYNVFFFLIIFGTSWYTYSYINTEIKRGGRDRSRSANRPLDVAFLHLNLRVIKLVCALYIYTIYKNKK